MPDSLSRREFLKELGLLGLGAGMAPAVLGPIEAFGEQWSDTAGYVDHPSWVKTVDKPTMEIDWDVMERFAETNTCRAGTVKYAGEDNMKAWAATGTANKDKWMKEGKPGFALRDWALSDAIRRAAFGGAAAAKSFVGPDDVPTPEDRGVPRWEGTPEENALMVRSALRHFGAATVGFDEHAACADRHSLCHAFFAEQIAEPSSQTVTHPPADGCPQDQQRRNNNPDDLLAQRHTSCLGPYNRPCFFH